MIASFADQGTEDIFNGEDTSAAHKTLTKAMWRVAKRKLDMVNAAAKQHDLRVPPANRFEALAGDLAGSFSIRVNDQFRVIFKFEGGNASEVRISKHYEE